MDGTREPVRDELDTYSEAVDQLVETTGEHSRRVDGLDAAMATLRESVTEMNAAVDEYAGAIDEFDDAVASLQRTAAGEGVPGGEKEAAGEAVSGDERDTAGAGARLTPAYPAAGD